MALEHGFGMTFQYFPETLGNFIIPTFPKSMNFHWLKPPVLDSVEMSTNTEHVNFRMTIRESKVAMGIPLPWSFAACISLSCSIFWMAFGRLLFKLTGAFYEGNGWLAGGCWDDEIDRLCIIRENSLRLAPVSKAMRTRTGIRLACQVTN